MNYDKENDCYTFTSCDNSLTQITRECMVTHNDGEGRNDINYSVVYEICQNSYLQEKLNKQLTCRLNGLETAYIMTSELVDKTIFFTHPMTMAKGFFRINFWSLAYKIKRLCGYRDGEPTNIIFHFLSTKAKAIMSKW